MIKYRYRYLARFVIECTAPLAIGSGESSIASDAQVARDVNGLPYIPGSSLAGLISHSLDKDLRKNLMGFQEGDNGQGSRIIFTEGKLLNKCGTPIDGLQELDSNDEYLQCFSEQMPIRQHVRIDEKGVAEDRGKFDEEVVPIGARFCFELEMLDEDGDQEGEFKNILHEFSSPTFRIGSGSRSGFGKIKVISTMYRKIDLENHDELNSYLEKPSSLSEEWKGWKELESQNYDTQENAKSIIQYTLEISPEDFILFSSGLSDNDADITVVKEHCIDWSETPAKVIDREKTILIPASSVKGAISHRTAFHYNRRKKYYIGDENAKTGAENEAVKVLFGFAGDDKNSKDNKKRGIVLFSDVLQEKKNEFKTEEPMLNHVKIDRFTGGAIAGALFQEKPYYAKGETFTLDITLIPDDTINDDDIIGAFEDALKDICSGLLPLGGGVNRGHGCFQGKIIKDGKEL